MPGIRAEGAVFIALTPRIFFASSALDADRSPGLEYQYHPPTITDPEVPMKKIILLAAALLLLLMLPAAHAEEDQHQLHMIVEFDHNIIMLRYDVEMYLNGQLAAIIDHGDTLDKVFTVPEGLCEIRFCRVGKASVSNTVYVGVNKDTVVDMEIHANMRNIKFRHVTTTADPSAYVFGLGEEANFGGYCVSVTGCRTADSYGALTPRDGKVFLICQMDVTNRTQSDIVVTAVLSTLNLDACCDDYELDCVWSAMYGLGGEFNATNIFQILQSMTRGTEVIRPGKRLAIELVYEVDPDWQVLELFYGNKQLAIDSHEVVFVAPRQ